MSIPALPQFLVTPAQAFGLPVCRLGLATYGRTAITTDDILSAVDRGVKFLNWQGLPEGRSDGDAFPNAVSSLGARRRSVIVGAQFCARNQADAATELRSALAELGTDYFDVLTLYCVERKDEWEEITASDGALGYLQDARRDGTVRRIGITSHQRTPAAEMAKSGSLDTVMIRYNAAHRSAERELFPVTPPIGLPVIARPPAWYRFVLQHPAVAVTLCAPQTRAELDEDLRVLTADGPLTSEEFAAFAEHGERVRRHAGGFR